MANKKQVSTKKIKKKKWYPIIAPKLFNNKVLGESLLFESISMKGKHMTMNVMNITKDPRKQNTNIQFLIKDVKEGQGVTEIVKFERVNSYLKRLIRRGKSKVDDSFAARSGEGRRVRVKVVMVTNTKAPKSVGTKLRLNVRQILKEKIKRNSFERTVDELLRGNFQKDIKKEISKIAPVRIFELRTFQIEEGKEGKAKEVNFVEEVGEEKEETTEVKEVSEDKSSDDAQKSGKISDKAKEETKETEEKVEEKKEEEKETKEEKTEEKEKKKIEKKEEKPKKEAKEEVKKKPKKTEKKEKKPKKKTTTTEQKTSKAKK